MDRGISTGPRPMAAQLRRRGIYSTRHLPETVAPAEWSTKPGHRAQNPCRGILRVMGMLRPPSECKPIGAALVTIRADVVDVVTANVGMSGPNVVRVRSRSNLPHPTTKAIATTFSAALRANVPRDIFISSTLKLESTKLQALADSAERASAGWKASRPVHLRFCRAQIDGCDCDKPDAC
jgi:hypothetical protein